MAGEREESIKSLVEDMEDWGEFYSKYKYQLDKVTDYEKRIEVLENRLDNSRGGFSNKTEKEKMQILSTTALFMVAATIFIRIITRSPNQWLFFFGGILVGIGAAAVLKMWTM